MMEESEKLCPKCRVSLRFKKKATSYPPDDVGFEVEIEWWECPKCKSEFRYLSME